MNKREQKQFPKEDFDFGTRLEFLLCDPDIGSFERKIYAIAQTYNNILTEKKYGHSFYHECQRRETALGITGDELEE